MAKDNSNSFNNNSSLHSEPGSNKSFVKKVRSRVSGLFPTSLSKWFGNDDNNKATVRQRDEEDDDEYCDIQPPSKRAKLPSPTSLHNNFHTFTSVNESNRIHSVAEERQNHFKSALLEPAAGPSGVKSRKIFTPTSRYTSPSTENLLVNGDKDSDSGESTSGYSSMPRISHKNVEDGKKDEPTTPNVNPNNLFNSSTFGNHSRSLFADRSLSPQINSSLSSRRPSFNASTFGSPQFVDRTLSTKRIINSPFYSGRTTYGGASAYGFQQKQPKRESIKNQVQIKPVNKVTENAALSKTARRILDTLEQYGTPVSDAKKIPNPKKPRGLLTKYTGANPYLMREHKASNRELQLPTVPDLLKMKLKERLQDSTVAVRQIATSSKSTLNSDEYKIRTDEEETPKHSNKMKTKMGPVRQHKVDDEKIEAVKLPEIPLPITTLPKFDFSLPLPPSCTKPLVTIPCNEVTQAPAKPVIEKSGEAPRNQEEPLEFTFANPLVLAENLVSIIAINDFKFSDPVIKQKNKFKPSSEINFKSADPTSMTLKRKNSNKEEVKPLLFGSVEDILSKKSKPSQNSLLDKFKPAVGTWECASCMLRNLPDKVKCAACEAPKDKIVAPPPSFGDKFKMSADKWECEACMVRNASTEVKCASCTTPKPGSSTPKPNGPLLTTLNTFGDKFKAPTSTWECPTCMIRNDKETDKCVACETLNPNKKPSFGDAFKKKSTEWECDTCMVRNSIDKLKCLSCETPKPGAKVAATSAPAPTPTFTFGFFPTNSPGATSTQGVKLADEKPIPTGIFGNKTEAPAEPQTFKFGIPAAEPESKVVAKAPEAPLPAAKLTGFFKPTVPVVKPVEKPEVKTSAPPPATFTFGAKPEAAAVTTDAAPPKPVESFLQKPVGGFSFGTSTTLKRPNESGENPTTAPKIAPSPASIIFSPPKVPLVTAAAAKTDLITKPPVEINGSAIKHKKVFFGAPAPNKTFTFKPTTESKPPVATSAPTNLFNFGAKTTAPSTFGNPSTTTATFGNPSTTTSTFGNPSTTTSTFGNPSTTTSTFGNPSTTTSEAPAAQPPMFKFGAAEQPTKPFNMAPAPQPIMFGGATTPSSSIFGTPNKPVFEPPNTKPPVFETPNKSLFETPNKTVFDAPTSKPVFDTPPAPTFGGFQPTAPATSEIKPFSFGAQTTPTPKPFAFGAKPAEPAKVAAPFNFGATPAPASTGGFSFSNTNPAPSSGGFSFNAPKVDNPLPFQAAAPAPTSIFGKPPAQPQQQQQPVQQNGGFNFGAPAANNNNVKTGFNFGVAAPAAPPPQFNQAPLPPAPGVFSFGNNPNPAPAGPGGFNFGPNQAAPNPAFNVNMKPTFNFTGGSTPTFSAQPTGESQMVAQRKKIRAVRRTQR